jgi:hypothetical protein
MREAPEFGWADAARNKQGGTIEHDPEKWTPVFGKDHAPAMTWRQRQTGRMISPEHESRALLRPALRRYRPSWQTQSNP